MTDQRRFSSRQITVIIASVCFAVAAAPVGVMAATGAVTIADRSNASHKAAVNGRGGLAVTPRDPVSGHQAKVDKGGHLVVGDGKGAMTVDGTVTAYPFTRAKAFSTDLFVSNSAVAVRPGHRIYITSITVDNASGSAGDVRLYQTQGMDASCSGGYYATTYWSGFAEASANVVASFPSPLVVTDPCASFLVATGTASLQITVTGYDIS